MRVERALNSRRLANCIEFGLINIMYVSNLDLDLVSFITVAVSLNLLLSQLIILLATATSRR